MSEERAEVGGGITLCYETFGSPEDPAVLLVMGLGMQMLAWDERFCEDLAGRGFFVIRYDNRDSGHSTHFDDVPPPGLAALLTRSKRGVAYRLPDMALDAVGLLDALGIERAHVVGASMGGMIAQTIAAKHPTRVRSLTSIMSNTGARWTGQPAFKTYPIFLAQPPHDREGYVEHSLKLFRAIGSTAFEREEEELREVIGRGFDRKHDPSATGRQLHAILATGNRTRELRSITAPTLVIHGDADTLVRPSGGKATAKAIPNARLMTIPGMGHDLPRGVWPEILDAIEQHARAADRAAGEPARDRAAAA